MNREFNDDGGPGYTDPRPVRKKVKLDGGGEHNPEAVKRMTRDADAAKLREIGRKFRDKKKK